MLWAGGPFLLTEVLEMEIVCFVAGCFLTGLIVWVMAPPNLSRIINHRRPLRLPRFAFRGVMNSRRFPGG